MCWVPGDGLDTVCVSSEHMRDYAGLEVDDARRLVAGTGGEARIGFVPFDCEDGVVVWGEGCALGFWYK